MGLRQSVRRWWDGTPGRPEEVEPGGGLHVVGASAERATVRAGRQRTSPWTSEPESCEVCGRHLLVGELPAFYQRDDQIVMACPVCSTLLAAHGLRAPVTPEPTVTVVKREADKNPDFAKTWESMQAFRARYAEWLKIGYLKR